jgi:hypothetical protein
VVRRRHLSNLKLNANKKQDGTDEERATSPRQTAAHCGTFWTLIIWLSILRTRGTNQTPDRIKQKQNTENTHKRSGESVDAKT